MLKIATACSLLAVSSASPTFATTVAYYRFEEGPDGSSLTGSLGGGPFTTTADSVGGGGPLRTFNSPAVPSASFDTSPIYRSFVPTAVVPQTGAANNFSFEFGSDNVLNDDIYQSTSSTLNTSFDGDTAAAPFTVEAYVYPVFANFFYTFIGRDRSGAGLGNVLFQTAIDNSWNFIAFNKADVFTNLSSGPNTVAYNQWNHVATTFDGTDLKLYVNGTLAGTLPGFSGLRDDPGNPGWTIGRGWNSGPSDFFKGNVDEVRFSSVALPPSQFLNAVIPEPASAGLLSAAASAILLRRRR